MKILTIDYHLTKPENIILGLTRLPTGLEDVSKYPDLIAALIEKGTWSEEDIKKLLGENLLRVFRATEKVRE